VAQAWHWVDPARAVPEVARVLRPGGQLGLLWNIRDERADWVAGLGTILRQSDGAHAVSGTVSAAPRVGPPFGQLERRDVGWVHHLSPDALVDMVSSRSYVSTMPPADHDKLLRVLDGKHLQQQRVHDGEDGGICADAQRQSDNGNCCESRTFAQLPNAISQVLS